MNESRMQRIAAHPFTTALGVFVYLLFRNVLSPLTGNELDVMPVARHAFDNWLAHDWYLGNSIGYRAAFNTVFGALPGVIGFEATVLFGRTLICALFAVIIALWGQALRIPPVLTIFAFAVFYNNQSLVADEWMIKSLETKPFAYLFVLVGAYLAHRNHFRWSALCFGLATSMHVLVGGYATMAALGVFAFHQRLLSLPWSTVVLFALGAANLWWVLLRQLGGGFAQEAVELYVHYRVPHHVDPSVWPSKWLWAFPGLLLGIIALRNCSRAVADFACVSALIFSAGLIAWWIEADRLLRYYPFRLADVVLPLVFTTLVAVKLSEWIRGARSWVPRLAPVVLTLLAAGAIGDAVWHGAKAVAQGRVVKPPHHGALKALAATQELLAPESVLLAPPDLDSVYWVAGRSQVVTRKHFPQSSDAILEWHRRLVDVTSGAAERERNPKALARAFLLLTEEEVRALGSRYKASHLLTRSRYPGLPVIVERDDWWVYALPR